MNTQRALIVAVSIATPLLLQTFARSCPFCNVVAPTFAERRESADICALASVAETLESQERYEILRVHKGDDRIAPGAIVRTDSQDALPIGSLVLLLGKTETDETAPKMRWEVIAVDETSYLYFARAPDLRTPAGERLIYFIPYLEHESTAVAEDAFAELGRAALDEVETVADRLPMEELRAWIRADDVPRERRGGFGVLLGLAADNTTRRLNAAALRDAVDEPAEDFRAGFDGLLAGYLLADPAMALKLIDERFVDNAEARPGDTRHALAALRFCVETSRGPDKDAAIGTMRHALARPKIAADVIVDLARWQDWESLPRVAPLFDTSGDDFSPLRRAVVGYLKACPLPEAAQAMEGLRAENGAEVERLERELKSPLVR